MNITVTAFIKGGGQESVRISTTLLADLSAGIARNGSETIQLVDGFSLDVTGILITGSAFKQEERIIVSGVEANND